MRGSNFSSARQNSPDSILYGRTEARSQTISTLPFLTISGNQPWHRLGLTVDADNSKMAEGWFNDINGWSGVDNQWYVTSPTGELPPELAEPERKSQITTQVERDTISYSIDCALGAIIDERDLQPLGAEIAQIDQNASALILKKKSFLQLNRKRTISLPYLLAVEAISNRQGYWSISGQDCFYRDQQYLNVLGIIPIQGEADE